MGSTLEQAITWIMSDPVNIKAFRANIDVVKQQFPGLSDADLATLQAVHEKGLNAEELDGTDFAEVEAQRSYGWSATTRTR